MSTSTGWTRGVDTLVGRRGAPAIDTLVIASLVLYVVLFLAVRRATNACFFVLVLLAVFHFAQRRETLAAAWRTAGSRTLVAALASVFAAVVAAKLLRGELDSTDLDGPARYLLAGLLMLFLVVKQVRFVRLFAAALPLALLASLAAVLFNAETATRWEGRFATYFVDPNTLGSCAVILTFMTLLTVDGPGRSSPWRRALAVAGIAAGLVLALFAASRGGWAAALPLTVLWLLFRRRQGVRRLACQGLAVLAVMGIVMFMAPDIAGRGIRGVDDARAWLDGTNPVTPVGQRLEVWRLSLALIAASPLVGYGWEGVPAQLARPEFAAAASPEIMHILVEGGPHSDLLTMALTSGALGIAAFVALLFGPAVFFWRRRDTGSDDARLACELGICLIAGVLLCGLSNEMLSLKYLASFFGLTVAGLAAQVLGEQQPEGRAAPTPARVHP